MICVEVSPFIWALPVAFAMMYYDPKEEKTKTSDDSQHELALEELKTKRRKQKGKQESPEDSIEVLLDGTGFQPVIQCESLGEN